MPIPIIDIEGVEEHEWRNGWATRDDIFKMLNDAKEKLDKEQSKPVSSCCGAEMYKSHDRETDNCYKCYQLCKRQTLAQDKEQGTWEDFTAKAIITAHNTALDMAIGEVMNSTFTAKNRLVDWDALKSRLIALKK